MNIEYKKMKDYLRYIPDFYKEILQTWIKMGGGQTKTLSHFAEIRKQLGVYTFSIYYKLIFLKIYHTFNRVLSL
jgi:hypothetical protein